MSGVQTVADTTPGGITNPATVAKSTDPALSRENIREIPSSSTQRRPRPHQRHSCDDRGGCDGPPPSHPV